ncbi:hypothetical protein Tcan_09074 [Toxocara canis]|uniref:Uncharacterized protein n=1 Tax=Toxocara canis TaxID=6265 RepID=A0A0B2V9Z8_TOXCA|nr:hypothetical protein Tcan_09074 [Toxocara canis]
MLGMMNAGGDTPADFFSPIRPSSLFRKERYWEKAKETISYTSDGRLLVDGRPMAPEDPEDMWTELILRVLAYRLHQKSEKANAKAQSFWKRWPTKFVKRSISAKDELTLNAEYVKPFAAHEGFVTTIKVSSPNSPMQQKISFDGRRVTT